MEDKILNGQTAIITGGGRGIGREITFALAEAGANTLVCAKNAKEIQDTCDIITGLGGTAIAVTADVSDRKSAENTVNQAISKFDKIDILVNNAGVSGMAGRIWEVSPEEWLNTLNINLAGAFYFSHYAMKEMIKRKTGRIINIASNAALFSLPDGYSAYSVSKAGLLRLTGSLAAEGRDYGVMAFAISPGLVKTSMTKDLDLWKDVPDDKWSPVEASGSLCVKLASGKADKLTGRYIHVSDDLDVLIAKAGEIIEKELYTLTLNRI